MSSNVFRYPGGKTLLSSWILDKLPQHHTYVEPFAGSAAVLANKPLSNVEIINDLDGDIVHFFRTLRDRGDELKEWLERTPFARQLHEEYASEFYDGVRPDDDVERAGRFFYLRETQFAQKYTGVSGFRYSAKSNLAEQYSTKVEQLERWQRRFETVQIEQLDFAEVFEKYDREETFFYCDPPYVEEGDDLYSHGEFDHDAFVNALSDTEGRWMVSYTDVPPRLRELAETVVAKDRDVSMRAGQGDWEKTNTERLVMNYDPDQTPRFTERQQSGLGAYAGGDPSAD